MKISQLIVGIIFYCFIPVSLRGQVDTEFIKMDINELLNVSINKSTLPIIVDSQLLISGQTFNIGMVLPISKYPGLTTELIDAANLAVEEINKTGINGRKICLVIADDAADRTIAVERAKTLIQDYHVKAIIGPTNSQRVIEIANKVTIPCGVSLIALNASSDAISELDDNDLVWRFSLKGIFYVKALSNFILKNLKKRKAGIIYVNNSYGNTLYKDFNHYFTKNGGKIICKLRYSELIDLEQYDMKIRLDSFFSHKPKVVFFINNAFEDAIISKKIEVGGYLTPKYQPAFVSVWGKQTNFMLNLASQQVLKSFYGITYTFGKDSVFLSNYKTKFNKQPENTEIVAAYDAVYILALAQLMADNKKNSNFNQYIRTITENGETINANEFEKAAGIIQRGGNIKYCGAVKNIHFDNYGDLSSGTFEIWRIENNQFITMEKIIVN